MVQNTVETPVEEKSMAVLAEVLRERGIRVTQVVEDDDALQGDVMSFRDDDETAFTAAEIALNSSYPLKRLISYRRYMIDEPIRIPVPDNWVTEFSSRWLLQDAHQCNRSLTD